MYWISLKKKKDILLLKATVALHELSSGKLLVIFELDEEKDTPEEYHPLLYHL
jgi:hypothetical protein